jgi:hypothetical protein
MNCIESCRGWLGFLFIVMLYLFVGIPCALCNEIIINKLRYFCFVPSWIWHMQLSHHWLQSLYRSFQYISSFFQSVYIRTRLNYIYCSFPFRFLSMPPHSSFLFRCTSAINSFSRLTALCGKGKNPHQLLIWQLARTHRYHF